MPVCKSCGAQVRWIKTETGRPAPVNIKPERRIIMPRSAGSEPKKCYVFDERDRTWYLWNTYPVTTDTVGGIEVEAFVPHFDVCPHADAHRKRKAASR